MLVPSCGEICRTISLNPVPNDLTPQLKTQQDARPIWCVADVVLSGQRRGSREQCRGWVLARESGIAHGGLFLKPFRS